MDGYAVTVRRLPGGPLSRSEVGVTPAEPVKLTIVTPAEHVKLSIVRRAFRWLGKLGVNIAFVAMLGCVAIMLVPPLAGYQRFIIMTGSMTGTYDRGSIVFDKPVPTASLKVGDPITYNPPPGFTTQKRVSHRIWRITKGKDGVRIYKTKGDANKHPDVWSFTLPGPTQDEVKFHIPEVGYLFLLLSLRNFRLILVGIPAILIGLNELRKLWREGGAEVGRVKLAALGWRQLSYSGSGALLTPIDIPAASRHVAVLDLRLPAAAPTPSNSSPASPKRRVRLRAGTTLRINRLGTDQLLRSANDRRQSRNADHLALWSDAATRPLRIRRLPAEVRALERSQRTDAARRSSSLGER
jgi:signal peptidase I